MPPTSATSATQELDKLMASLSDFHLRRTVSPGGFQGVPPPPPILPCTPITLFCPPSHLQPPPKKGVPEGENLDSMLVLLQSDLSRQGVPTGAKGVCGSCQKPIAGKVSFGVPLGEGGRCVWVPGVAPQSVSFLVGIQKWGTLKADLTQPGPQNGVSPLGMCPPPQVVKALGCAWHPEHFVCARCGGELGGGSFFEKDGVPYCPRDYGRLFSPRCARCAQPILDVGLGGPPGWGDLLGGLWEQWDSPLLGCNGTF